MNQWEKDNKEISRIQFQTNFPQQTKNEMIGKIEKRMEIEEQKELDGKGTGYYGKDKFGAQTG